MLARVAQITSKKLIPALAVACALLMQPAQAESSWSAVQKKGVLRCGAAVAPVYVMRDATSGQYSGIHAELCRDFGEQVLKVKVEFVDATWDNIVAGIQSNKWDMALALNPTPARALVLSFSDPVVESQTALVVNRDNPKFAGAGNRLEDYDKPDVRITSHAGSVPATSIAAVLKKAGLQLLPGTDETRLALISRRADALSGDSIEVLPFIKANPQFTRVLLEPALARGYVAFGLSREMSAQDLAVLNIYLRARRDAGDFERMTLAAVEQAVKQTVH